MLPALGKLAPYIPLAIEFVRGLFGTIRDAHAARKAEEERKRAEAESLRKGPSDAVQSQGPTTQR